MRTFNSVRIFTAIAAILTIGFVALSESSGTAHAQATTPSCTNISISNGKPIDGSAIAFNGVYFSPENSITMQGAAMSLFKQSGTTNTVQYVLYEADDLPSTLGIGQPEIDLTSPMPLWSSGEIATVNYATYDGLSSGQRGDPNNWHTETVSPSVALTPGTVYALVAYGVTNASSSFSNMLVLGLSATVDGGIPPPCGIANTGLFGGGQVYTMADSISGSSITSVASGCALSVFVFPCSTSLEYESIGFAIYGVEIISDDDAVVTVDAWIPAVLEDIGINSPMGKLLMGSIIIIAGFAILTVRGVHWLLAMGTAGMIGTSLTVATIFSPEILLSMVAIAGFGGMIFVLVLVMGGDRDG